MVDGCTPTFVVNFYRHVDGVLQYNMTCHGANTYCHRIWLGCGFVRIYMDVNEHESLSNITLRHKLK
jgi:hypothetical protein